MLPLLWIPLSQRVIFHSDDKTSNNIKNQRNKTQDTQINQNYLKNTGWFELFIVSGGNNITSPFSICSTLPSPRLVRIQLQHAYCTMLAIVRSIAHTTFLNDYTIHCTLHASVSLFFLVASFAFFQRGYLFTPLASYGNYHMSFDTVFLIRFMINTISQKVKFRMQA